MMNTIVYTPQIAKKPSSRQKQMTPAQYQAALKTPRFAGSFKVPEAHQVMEKKELLMNLPPVPFQKGFDSAFQAAENRGSGSQAKLGDFLIGLLEPLVYVAEHLNDKKDPMMQMMKEARGIQNNDKEEKELFLSFLPPEAKNKKLKADEIFRILYKPYEKWLQKNVLPFKRNQPKDPIEMMIIGGGMDRSRNWERIELEPSLKQLLTGFIQAYPESSLDRTGPRFFEYLKDVAANPTTPNDIRNGALFFQRLQAEITESIKSGQGIEKLESDSVEGFSERLAELYDENRPAAENFMNKDQAAHANKLIKRFERANPQSPEHNVLLEQLHTLLYDLPWKATEDKDVSLDQVKKQLDDDHYGLEEVKEYILNHMSQVLHVQELKKEGKLDESLEPPNIICLVGPPGVGKTSLGKSIAESLGRKFIRKSLGGVNDEAEIRGHRSTYIGAKAGRIVEGMIKAGSTNPVYMLDEIDKLNSNIKGDPASALLEVLDPEQNHSFQDNYLDVGIDLSQVFFIATANYEDRIPPALKDRMHVIRIDGYMPEEKIVIAQKHLIPRARKSLALNKELFNLDKEPLTLSDKTLSSIIEEHAPERGVRQLNNKILQIAKGLIRNKHNWKTGNVPDITPDSLEKWLGKPDFVPFKTDAAPKVGRVYGMFYSDGAKPGGTLPIYVKASVRDVDDPEKAGLSIEKMTGNFKEVMKESVDVAYGFITTEKKQLAEKLKPYGVTEKTFDNKRVQLFVSAKDLAVPKDGPSAGTAFAVNLLSAITGIPVRGDTAITGEFDLFGNVTRIGGVREKVTGAYQEGVRNFILPKSNQNDEVTIPESVRKNITIHYADTIYDVVDHIFVPPAEQAAQPEAPRFAGNLRSIKQPSRLQLLG